MSGTVNDAAATISVSIAAPNARGPFAAVNNGATWTLANDVLAPGLPAGTHNVVVTATDAATNAGTDATAGELTISLGIQVSPAGSIMEGDVVTLDAPAGSTGHQWKKGLANVVNSAPRVTGATGIQLKFDTVLVSDSGSYTVTYTDGAKAIVTSPPFVLVVAPLPSGVPAAGVAGLVALSALMMAGYAVRRRKQ